jgi:hypothetical protein
MTVMGGPGSWRADRIGLLNWSGFFDTKVRATSQIVCGHRKVVVNASWCPRPNKASKSVMTDRSAPANRLMDCQSSPTAIRNRPGLFTRPRTRRARARLASWNSSTMIRS